jgi:hypothetical protein
LVNGITAIGRAAWVIRIAQDHASFHKIFYSFVADRFAGIGLEAATIGFGDELNDGSDAAKWLRCGFPRCAGMEIKQCQQCVGGGFVALFRSEAQ